LEVQTARLLALLDFNVTENISILSVISHFSLSPLVFSRCFIILTALIAWNGHPIANYSCSSRHELWNAYIVEFWPCTSESLSELSFESESLMQARNRKAVCMRGFQIWLQLIMKCWKLEILSFFAAFTSQTSLFPHFNAIILSGNVSRNHRCQNLK